MRVVVAGQICLDILPNLEHLASGQFAALFQPGRLIEIGAARFATGGAVLNTGLALHRLGIPVRLVGKIGDDPLGAALRSIVAASGAGLAAGIVVDPATATSFTFIVNPPGADRTFLYCPAANDTFGPEDVAGELLTGATLFHLGYPPLLGRMYRNGGVELVELLRRARASGATTSLDLSFPDPSAASGQADWRAILETALPSIDLFLPSVEELLFMLRRDAYERMRARGDVVGQVTPQLLSALGGELLDLGAKIVMIKLADRGIYLRAGARSALDALGRARPTDCGGWAGRELWAPSFVVDVAGTTGAGDAAVAGLIAGLLGGLGPCEALTAAAAVGACCVEAPDATGGVRGWAATLARVRAGWPRRPLHLDAPGWAWSERDGLWEKV